MNDDRSAERSYIAFISYRHLPLDRSAAIRIQKKIENYTIPKEYREQAGGSKLGVVFRDEDELPASSSLSDSITYALDHSQYLIVICTPELTQSKWCLQEVRHFLKTHDRDHVLAVLADGSPEESFPEELRFSYDEEGNVTAETEPLAANIAGKDHNINNKTFKKEVTRLIAAMLGCPFDALWQREKRARTNRLIAGMGTGLAVMAVVMALVLSQNARISRQNDQISEQNGQIMEQMSQISEQNDQIKEQIDQISEQNEKIEQQYSDLQQQYSSALVSSGRMQLDSFQRFAALDSAIKALESNDPAIYDHGAELLLADALGAYDYQQSQYDTFFDQNTDITNLAVSGDGTTVFTGDGSGVVRALSLEDSSLLWEQTPGGNNSPVILPLKQRDLVLCLCGNSIAAFSVEDGETVWSQNLGLWGNSCMLSEDHSLLVIMASEQTDLRSFSLLFFDTVTGNEVFHVPLPLEEFNLRQRGLFGNQFGGAFTSDNSRFVCLIPCLSADDGSSSGEFFLVDMNDGDVTRLGSLDGLSQAVLAMDAKDDSVYCAFLQNTDLISAIIPFDRAAEKTVSTYIYSKSFRNGVVTDFALLNSDEVVPALFGDDLVILFHYNTVYIMDRNTGKLSYTFSLNAAVVSAAWTDPAEGSFQLTTSDGWLIKYSYAYGKGFNSTAGEQISPSRLRLAVHVRDGFYCDPAEGCTLVVSNDDPRRLILVKKTSDPAIVPFEDDPVWAKERWAAKLSPSGNRLFIFAKNGDLTQVTVFDAASGEKVGEQIIGTPAYQDGLVTDDDCVLFGNTYYRLDGSVSAAGSQLSNILMQPILLSDGTMLFAEESTAFERSESGKEMNLDVRALQYQYGAEVHDLIGECICMQQESDFPGRDYIFAAGKNGWLAGYGLYTIVGDDQTKIIAETPVLAAQNAATGKQLVLEDFSYQDLPVTRLVVSNRKPFLAAELEDGQVLLFDLEKNSGLELPPSYAFGEIHSMCFSDQDNVLLICTSSGCLDCYDPSTGELLYSGEGLFPKAEKELGSYDAAVSELSDERTIISITYRYDTAYSWALILDTGAWVPTARIDNYGGCSAVSGQIFLRTGNALSRCPIHSLEDLKELAKELIYWTGDTP